MAGRRRYVRRLAALTSTAVRLAHFVVGEDDPNDQRLQGGLAEGLCEIPLSTFSGRRRGARERVLCAKLNHGLSVEFDALATRVLLDADKRAIGVEYMKGRNLYRASPDATGEAGAPRRVGAAREVILAGGAFNTPQTADAVRYWSDRPARAFGIKVEVALEGVGRNLQDRYEVGVVHKMSTSVEPACRTHASRSMIPSTGNGSSGRGMYISNGAALAFALRSSAWQANPDLFVMALLTRFSGYFPGYSDVIRKSHDDLTFALLKAHTQQPRRNGKLEIKRSSRSPTDRLSLFRGRNR